MALAEFIVAFREFFEIFAILAIILTCLKKTGNWKLAKHVYAGAGAAAIASIAFSYFFSIAGSGFEFEELFEGATLIIAAFFITWLLMWMFSQGSISKRISRGVEGPISRSQAGGIAIFSFIAVLREGIEIVLFITGIKIVANGIDLAWFFMGAFFALVLAGLVFASLIRLDFGRFFKITGALLVLLAGGMLGQGIHELQEAHVLPTIVGHLYDINWILDEKGVIGGALKGIAGYDANPSLLQALFQFSYYIGAALYYRKISASQG